MKTIKKKIWPEYFKLVKRGKRSELRLGDFKAKKGDILLLQEYNPKTKKYTGRKIIEKIKNIVKINPFRMYAAKEIKKYGFYVIELR